MAARRPTLSAAQIELMTDLMVMKLATLSAQARNDPDSIHWLNSDERGINRDEIRLVIVDTAILAASEDPAALLDEWRESA